MCTRLYARLATTCIQEFKRIGNRASLLVEYNGSVGGRLANVFLEVSIRFFVYHCMDISVCITFRSEHNYAVFILLQIKVDMYFC